MSETLIVNSDLAIPLDEIELTAVRAQGAGGQRVNKVATAIHLRFDARCSKALPDAVRARLLASADRRITADGVVIIKAQSFRSQEKNRQEALRRLGDLLRAATVVPAPRKPSQVSPVAQRNRVDDKRKRGQLKKDRRRIDPE